MSLQRRFKGSGMRRLLRAPRDGLGQLPVPYSIDNLYSWLRADDVLLNGGNVETWNDLSGNGRTATQPLALSRATYTAEDVNFNNQPTATFNGTTDLYIADWLMSLTNGAAAFTTFAVHGLGASTSDLWSSGLSSSTGIYVRFGRLGGGALFTQRHDGAAETDSASTGIGAQNYSALTYDGTGGDIWLNGAKDLTGYTSAQNPSTMDQGAIGCLHRVMDSNFWSAEIAELIFYSRKLSDAEIATVNTYLADRYAI